MSRKFGDRKDGKLLRDIPSLNYITGIIYPNRCDNEAYISETVETEAINKYIAEKNAQNPDFKYNMFHVIVSAICKTITLRPKLNYFIQNGNFYERNEVMASFVVKKEFTDTSKEGLATVHVKGTDTFEDIHNSIKDQVIITRSGKSNSTGDSLDLFHSIPRFISKAAIHFIMHLDKHGKVPYSLISEDPYYSSVVLSNLGSIKLKCGYHHLTNWGTCSFFCVIGEKKLRPIFKEDGSYEMKETVSLGLTIDERIADGYYYSKSVRLLKHLLANPELLDLPFSQEVEY